MLNVLHKKTRSVAGYGFALVRAFAVLHSRTRRGFKLSVDDEVNGKIEVV